MIRFFSRQQHRRGDPNPSLLFHRRSQLTNCVRGKHGIAVHQQDESYAALQNRPKAKVAPARKPAIVR
jgi:hypothetical protein